MKKNHLIQLALAALLAFTLTATPGCMLFKNEDAAKQQQVIDDTAVLLRAAARNGAILAIEDNPKARHWFALAEQTLGNFVTGTDYSPERFQAALLAVPVSEFEDKWVRFAVFHVIDLYQLYYGRHVRDKIAGEVVAVQFLQAVQDGFKQALVTPESARVAD